MAVFRRAVTKVAFVAAVVSLLAGCGSSTASPSGSAAPSLTTVLGVSKTEPGPEVPGVAALANIPVSERPPLPAKYAQAVGPYTMAMETIASAAPGTSGLVASPGCTVSSVFKRGMRVVFRFQIYDMTTGKVVTDREGADAKVSLAQGGDVQAYFAARGGGEPGPDSPWTWAAVWNVPMDQPLGALAFSVKLTMSDGTTTDIKAMDGDGETLKIVD